VKGTARATTLADKRRHFVEEEVARCQDMKDVDIFLSHEAARPYRVRGNDAGKTAINDVLAAMRPRLHLFGHHHAFTEQVRQDVKSVGLDLVSRSYLLIDRQTLAYEQVKG
jgi:Icc-related predicted phosphoesterase